MKSRWNRDVIGVAMIGLLLLLAFSACRPKKVDKGQAITQAEVVAGKQNSVVRAPANTAIGFRARRNLDEHYEKHGREFGSISQDEYLRQAQTLRDAQAGGDVLEAKRSDGVITRFDRQTGAFLAFNADATIRTFFKPNDGERYFKRQQR